MTNSVIHDQEYEFYSWQKLGEDVFTLAQKIIKSQQAGTTPKFDRIIALAKGGLTFSRSMVDYLNVDNVSSIQIEFYSGIGTTNKTPVITQSLPVSIRDEHVLIFDDIVDKGSTLELALEYLQHHGAKSITTAALIQKPWAKPKPDFYVQETESWVIFPNEVRETVGLLNELWQEEGDSAEEITQNLLKIGFSKEEVDLFTNLK
jgi:hypoxanthine phosphoribosyltransferase